MLAGIDVCAGGLQDSGKRPGLTLVELLVAIGVISILMALLLPAVQKVRAAADRMVCQSNLRQLGIALHNYHGDHQAFPASGWTIASPRNPAGKYVGWRAMLTPYIEQDGVRARYDTSVHWWEEPNLSLSGFKIRLFLCPSTPDRPVVTTAVAKPPRPALTFPIVPAGTDYEAIMGVARSVDPILYATAATNRSVMFRNSVININQIYDGSSNTIMVVECAGRPLIYRGRVARPDLANDQGICWTDSEGGFSLDGSNQDGSVQGLGPILTPKAINATNDNEPYSFHPGGANFLFADGSVRYLRDTIGLLPFAALCTRSAGELVDLSEY